MNAAFAKKGATLGLAGSTSSTGAVTVTATKMSKCQPILDRSTEIHEGVHARHTKELEKKFGKGTPAFDAAWDEAQDWVKDELNARNAELAFLTKVLAALTKLEATI